MRLTFNDGTVVESTVVEEIKLILSVIFNLDEPKTATNEFVSPDCIDMNARYNIKLTWADESKKITVIKCIYHGLDKAFTLLDSKKMIEDLLKFKEPVEVPFAWSAADILKFKEYCNNNNVLKFEIKQV
jgi:hypothetical protein